MISVVFKKKKINEKIFQKTLAFYFKCGIIDYVAIQKIN